LASSGRRFEFVTARSLIFQFSLFVGFCVNKLYADPREASTGSSFVCVASLAVSLSLLLIVPMDVFVIGRTDLSLDDKIAASNNVFLAYTGSLWRTFLLTAQRCVPFSPSLCSSSSPSHTSMARRTRKNPFWFPHQKQPDGPRAALLEPSSTPPSSSFCSSSSSLSASFSGFNHLLVSHSKGQALSSASR
jgi:hypothetical protein